MVWDARNKIYDFWWDLINCNLLQMRPLSCWSRLRISNFISIECQSEKLRLFKLCGKESIKLVSLPLWRQKILEEGQLIHFVLRFNHWNLSQNFWLCWHLEKQVFCPSSRKGINSSSRSFTRNEEFATPDFFRKGNDIPLWDMRDIKQNKKNPFWDKKAIFYLSLIASHLVVMWYSWTKN